MLNTNDGHNAILSKGTIVVGVAGFLQTELSLYHVGVAATSATKHSVKNKKDVEMKISETKNARKISNCNTSIIMKQNCEVRTFCSHLQLATCFGDIQWCT